MYIINGETESWESGIAIQFERNLKGLHASIQPLTLASLSVLQFAAMVVK